MENIKKKINVAVIIILLVISGLFFIGKIGFNILSGVRAYVGGEGLWAKGQKDAVYQLTRYIHTQEEIQYELFHKSLKIPLGDRNARQELKKNNSNYEIIFKGFLDGRNHPDDIPTMIFLYKWFKNLGYINQAVYQWELGDNYIQDLLSVGEELHNLIKTDKLTSDKISQSLTYIDDLQKKLTDAENQFSYNMSMVARWAANFVFIVMLVFSVVGCLICIILIRFISGIISDLNYKKIQIETQAEEEKKIKIKLEESEKRFRALADTSPLAIYMSEGIKQKATYINPTFINLFGYTIDEVPTVDHLWPLAYPDPVYRKQVADEWQRRVEQAIESKTTIEPMEVAVTCKDGSKKDISWGFITIGEQNWACGLDLTARKQAEKEKEKTINELQKSLEEIRTLRGILPICASCKKIRDDKGYWTQIESYIRDHSEANFSHSICPECKKKLYPDFEEN